MKELVPPALRARLRPAWYDLLRWRNRLELGALRVGRRLGALGGRGADDPLEAPVLVGSSAEWLSSGAGERAGARYHRVDPPELVERRAPPATVEPALHPHFGIDVELLVPETFVLELPSGRAYGEQGAIITDDGSLLDDVSVAWQRDAKARGGHPAIANWRHRRLERVPGTVAVLSTDGADLYYHWLFQLLPRLDLLERAGFGPDRVDHYLVNGLSRAYERETLARLGIPAEKLLESRAHPHVRAGRLLVPSVPLFGSQFTKRLVRFVRRRVGGLDDGAAHVAPRPNGRRLYLSRGNAGYRRVVNEREVVRLVEAEGFEVLSMERLSLAEQVAAMDGAAVVLGPHGGALSNTVFCRPGTRVGEIFAPEYVAPWFWFLSEAAGLEHAYMLAPAAPDPRAADRWSSAADMVVDLPKLARLVALLTGAQSSSSSTT